jgi:hypothetical protein
MGYHRGLLELANGTPRSDGPAKGHYISRHELQLGWGLPFCRLQLIFRASVAVDVLSRVNGTI